MTFKDEGCWRLMEKQEEGGFVKLHGNVWVRGGEASSQKADREAWQKELRCEKKMTAMELYQCNACLQGTYMRTEGAGVT